MTKNGVTRLYGVSFMAVLVFVAYMSFTQPVRSEKPAEQQLIFHDVPAALDPHAAPPVASGAPFGKALAYIRIPRFGKQWLWTALEGTTIDVINQGPGHFPDTPLPGAEGNSVFASHRASHGDPFIDFDKLRVGDEVIFSQSGAQWTYKLTTAPVIVPKTSDWLLDKFAPGRWLTLITCWPRYGSAKRMYVRAELSDWSGK